MAVQNADFTTFLKVYEMTKKWEGGFSNDANDYGGYTYAGITQGSYNTFASSRGIPAKDVATLSQEEIHNFYYEDRWKPIMMEGFGYELSLAMFDISVNFTGPGDAWGFVAEAYGSNPNGDYIPEGEFQKWKDKLSEDIKSGKLSEKEFANEIMKLRRDYYVNRIQEDPSQEKFFDGWMNRTNDIYAKINGIEPPAECHVNREACTNFVSGGKNVSGLTPPSNTSTSSSGSPTSGSSGNTGSSDYGYANTSSSGGVIGATFARYPLPLDIRMRKCFEGYQRVGSNLMTVGGMGNVSGPPIAKDMTDVSKASASNNQGGSPSNELPSVDYGGYWSDPCPQAEVLTSGYTTERWGRPHPGVDIAGNSGVPILATAPGKVADVYYQPGGFGNLIVIAHNVGGKVIYSAYNHLLDNSTKVKVGDSVERGQHIADLGSTGMSTGPHLHFEIRTDWAGSRGDVLSTHADPACLIDRYSSSCASPDVTAKIVPKSNTPKVPTVST